MHYSHAMELYRRVLEKDEGEAEMPGREEEAGPSAVGFLLSSAVMLGAHTSAGSASLPSARSLHFQAAFRLPMAWAASWLSLAT